MTNTQLQCPGKNLGELVRRLNPVIFNSIDQRVTNTQETMSKLEQRYEEEECGLLLQLRDELESDLDVLDAEDVKYLRMLKRYGETRDEMVLSLGEHVQNHQECLDSYVVFLEAEANSNGYVKDVARRLGINLTDDSVVSREDVVRFLDRECYLGILN